MKVFSSARRIFLVRMIRYKALKTTLKAEINEEAGPHCNSAISRRSISPDFLAESR